MREPTDGEPIASDETHPGDCGRFRSRATTVLFAFVLWTFLVVGRMGYFMVLRRSHETSAMARESVVHGEIPALRGRLLDRDGASLAWSERRVRLLWSVPRDAGRAGADRARLLALHPWLADFALPAEDSAGEASAPLVLCRDLTAEQVQRIRAAPMRGVRLEGYVEREYGAVSASLRRRLGEIRWEGGRSVGISGLEREHDALLAGQPGLYRVLVDKRGQWVPETWQVLQPMRAGYDVHLALRRGADAMTGNRLQRAFEWLRDFLRPSLPSLAALVAGLWGCVAIHAVTSDGLASGHFVPRQLAWVALGLLVFAAARAVPFRVYRERVFWFAGVLYVALWLVLLVGVRVNGMRGWFAWRGLFCQPSELSKPLFVLCSTVCLLRWRGRDGRPALVPAAVCALAWLVPLALQPDFGAVLVYGVTLVALYWCLGGRLRHLLSGLGAGLAGAALVLWRYDYVRRRFVAFLDPERYATGAGWHLLQFRRSLAAGGWFGHSWEMGSWSRAYLPLGHSDSVFANLAEMVGFVGLLPFVVLILAWLVYAHSRACACASTEHGGVIFGLGALVAGQALIHLSVNVGLLPPTGITLPLVSYGGSSLLATMLAFGMLESAWREGQPPSGR